MKTALLAGTHSGCGKTSVMLALLQYLRNQGQQVVSFKSGPDFLDPLWHQAVTGVPSYNLDTQMIGIQQSCRILKRQSQNADLGLIEGVMGMFDGREGVGQAGSSADLAQQLKIPVILVVDVAGMAGSIVPLVAGFRDYASAFGVTVSGVIANKVGSKHHAGLVRNLLTEFALPPLLGWMEKNAPILAERHLGLVRPEESDLPDFQKVLHVEQTALLEAFYPFHSDVGLAEFDLRPLYGKTVAIARDAVCCFIYPDNLDCLQQMGATLKFFSPLAGEPVPQADALWLPGGYPEIYGQTLAKSPSLSSIRQFIQAGKPTLAECGGTMLLGEYIFSREGYSWPMAGVLPFNSRMQSHLAALGYRRHEDIRGHEFHHSIRESSQTFSPAFNCHPGDPGIRYKNLRASYNHWYFASAPETVAKWLL